ncbi:MAG: hypothetical protein EXR95_07260 [Gemmatimonadetes bacterium]|nr:hypothetical protein [Gemmatimonadota bacterium]
MNSFTQRVQVKRWAGAAAAFGVSLALGACSDLLDVTLPAQLTDDVLVDPVGAGVQINSVIANFESGMSDFNWQLAGHEDAIEIYLMSPSASSATTSYLGQLQSNTGYSSLMIARRFAKDLHAKLEKDWTVQQVPQRSQYLVITSIYEGAIYNWMASALCEGALDGGPLLTQKQMHDEAERVLTRAITEIGASDFAMPYGTATSALAMAYGLRAQHRWTAGDKAGAKADAEKVPARFFAYITREATDARRNMPFYAGTASGFAELKKVNDWWRGPNQPANPVTGKTWPTVIPFTGYQELGILLADGRAVRDDGLPIRRAGLYRTAVEDQAVPDSRIKFRTGQVQGLGVSYINAKYASEGDDIPLVNWKEMVLIRAEIDGGQKAIDLVNELRVADVLPRVTYANPNEATQIKYMIIEERRRALFLEGRFYYTKLQNLDLLWFPRKSGTLPGGINYQGGVKFAMPDNEYLLNTNIQDINKRGTGCDAGTRPTF